MRLAFISDIHGNLSALEAVLADIASRGADATYHLGDLVGYGPWQSVDNGHGHASTDASPLECREDLVHGLLAQRGRRTHPWSTAEPP